MTSRPRTHASPLLKRYVARTLCNPLVGKALSRLFEGRIPSRGFVFDTTGAHVPRFVVPRLFWGFYERAEIDFVHRHLDPELDVIELGGCLGVVATHVASRLRPGSKQLCVEANPRLLDTIRTNLDYNVPGNDVVIVNAAIDYSGAENVLFEVEPDAVSSRIATGEGDRVRARATTIEALRGEHGIGEFALISDIEGAEAGFILGQESTMKGCRQLIIELHPGHYGPWGADQSEILQRLTRAHGFRCLERHGDVHCFVR